MVADALSRRPMEISALTTIRILPKWTTELQPLYVQCADFAKIYNKLQATSIINLKREVYSISDSLLYHFAALCIPSIGNYRQQILEEAHSSILGGHYGFYKSFGRIKTLYYWPSMKSDLLLFLQECSTCQKNKYDRSK